MIDVYADTALQERISNVIRTSERTLIEAVMQYQSMINK